MTTNQNSGKKSPKKKPRKKTSRKKVRLEHFLQNREKFFGNALHAVASSIKNTVKVTEVGAPFVSISIQFAKKSANCQIRKCTEVGLLRRKRLKKKNEKLQPKIRGQMRQLKNPYRNQILSEELI